MVGGVLLAGVGAGAAGAGRGRASLPPANEHQADQQDDHHHHHPAHDANLQVECRQNWSGDIQKYPYQAFQSS